MTSDRVTAVLLVLWISWKRPAKWEVQVCSTGMTKVLCLSHSLSVQTSAKLEEFVSCLRSCLTAFRRTEPILKR